MWPSHWQAAYCILLLCALCRGQDAIPMPPPRPWDACDWVEGKGGFCRDGERPRAFEQFLEPQRMAKESGQWSTLSWFVGENPASVATWVNLGQLGGHRLRQIEYSAPPAEAGNAPNKFAGFVVIEKRPGLFSRLFDWCGSPMPEPRVVAVGRTNVLVIERDFGGNIPMVMTWAWVWTAKGPMRIEVEKAIQEAIAKVAPGHAGYDTGLDWSNLSTQTHSWGPDGWPDKVGVDETVRASFNLQENRLILKRVEWRKSFDDKAPVRRWP